MGLTTCPACRTPVEHMEYVDSLVEHLKKHHCVSCGKLVEDDTALYPFDHPVQHRAVYNVGVEAFGVNDAYVNEGFECADCSTFSDAGTRRAQRQ